MPVALAKDLVWTVCLQLIIKLQFSVHKIILAH